MNDAGDWIPTRKSLLSRLKDPADHKSWETFFDTYRRLIYNTAIGAGLTHAEAQDVVQETLFSVTRNTSRLARNAQRGSFKSWLLRLTRWRITDQFRKRNPVPPPRGKSCWRTEETDALERLPDPASPGLQGLWDEEWESNLLETALAQVKCQVDAKDYQAYDLYVLKNWPATKVARALKINPARVYLTKHRFNKLVKAEVARLQAGPF